jgi:ferredoxin
MLASFGKAPQKIAIEAYNDTTANPPFSACTLTRETFSCNICGYCKTVCPVDIDMGGLFRTARAGRVSVDTNPKAFHDFWLRDFEFTSGDGAFTFLPSSKGKISESVKYMFFPGCKLAAFAPDLVGKTYDLLRDSFVNNNAANVGLSVNCCGAPLLWAGEDEALSAHAEKLREIWTASGKPTFVFACAYCANVIGRIIPEIDGVSVYEILDGVGFTASAAVTRNYAIFDPCATSGNSAERIAARSVARACGIITNELPDPGKCCGYGGHTGFANSDLRETIINDRIRLSELPYLVRCANCYELFSRNGKSSLHLLDAATGNFSERQIPSLNDKRTNMLMLKNDYTGAEPKIKTMNSAPRVLLSDAASRDAENSYVLEDEIADTVRRAEKSGDYFIDSKTDARIACHTESVITIWVAYRVNETGDEVTVESVYCHRMKFRNAEAEGAYRG